jgi:hypothetical protein
MADVTERLNRVAEFAQNARSLAERWQSDELVGLCDDIEIMVAFCEMNLPNYALTTYIAGTAPIRHTGERDEVCPYSRIGGAETDV